MTWNPWRKGDDKDGSADGGPDGDETATADGSGDPQTTGKGRPTPRRREAERQRLRPLVPEDRKASSKQARKRLKEKENTEYEAMRTGDLAHMPAAERMPWRVFIRDYVDARWNVGEFFMPVAFGILILSMAVTSTWPRLTVPLLLLMYVYLLAVVIDVVLMWRRLKRRLIERFGERAVAKGSRSASYAWSRSIQMRRWRLPKPRYPKRGRWPE
ncbi:DUF3043 domain-containing protein [uncultured Bifidobacterium sp.]|uniref:DUF3043 domain-containing protein n=1 Tax=uncultured Bifidobacterium sp. TaxID=165187 RepID=UPI0028DB6F04|nr:DUF3043 domain-containing protein [uncultured Bifidobacterium sp.]